MRFWGSIIGVLLADQLSKGWIIRNFQLGETRVLIHGILDLTRAQNTGAAFSLLEGKLWLFILIAVTISVGAVWYHLSHKTPSTEQYSMGLIVGGAIGNVIDRISYGSVVDFFSIGWWPVFNIADMAIIAGGVLLMISIMRKEENEIETM